MSRPQNPISSKNTYSCRFVLVAFAKTDVAESAAPTISLDIGRQGEQFKGGYVVINDSIETAKAPTRFLVQDFNFHYEWTGTHINSTISGGTLIVNDTSGGEFLTFMKKKIVDRLGTSIENITFALKLFWTKDEDGDIVSAEPLYFSMSQIEHKISHNHHFYVCDIVPLYNTKASYSTYNRIYGMTITHESGNLHEEIPKAEPQSGGIKPRGAEDSEKTDPRTTRINKSKPMKTLGDVFKALEKELNESTKIHKGQLQEWQKVIREGFEDKLQKPNQQKELKINYKIKLDSTYSGYEINNRNIPFEQPEQRQNEIGIRSIPTNYGETIEDIIDRIMEYSNQIGIDAGETPAKDYKVCKVWRRNGNVVDYDIVIKRYTVPYNSATGINTGRGEGAKKPFEFFYKVPDKDLDIIMLDGIVHRVDGLDVVEEVNDSEAARLAHGGQREPITAERERDVSYFKTGFSGNRAKVCNQRVLGVEYPKELAQTIKTKYAMQNVQQSAMNITIHGNPELFSDLCRKPTDVANGDPGPALHYIRPEVLPMYAKVKIEHEPLEDGDSPEGDGFYHEEWMHIYRIDNIVTKGTFFQKLTLLRTDEMV